MRFIVAGSRTLTDYSFLKYHCDVIHYNYAISQVISGKARRGADPLGIKWAHERNIPVLEMPADWNTYGKQAGYLRNIEMSKVACGALLFWDGFSRGTEHMRKTMGEQGKPVFIWKFKA